jgi:hypothetical protein
MSKTQSGNIESGVDITFLNSNVFIDMYEYLKNKLYDAKHFDIIIEFIVFDTHMNKQESIFATMCKVYPDYKFNKLDSYRIKIESQKIKVNDQWFGITDVYGLRNENNECEICCCNKRNSIFLPCKHSYACKDCAVELRVRGNNCPICRIRKIKI